MDKKGKNMLPAIAIHNFELVFLAIGTQIASVIPHRNSKIINSMVGSIPFSSSAIQSLRFGSLQPRFS